MKRRHHLTILLLLTLGLGGCTSASQGPRYRHLPAEKPDASPRALLDQERIKPKEEPGPRPIPLTVRSQALSAVDAAVTEATTRIGGFQRLPEEPLTYREILRPDRTVSGSLSIGTVRVGALQNPAILPETGDHHQIIERHRVRRTNFGTSEMVSAIKEAAAEVAAHHGGAPLRVGNLGYARGGRIPWSASHEAGRDADLAFYTLDLEGRSVPSPDLLTFHDDGTCPTDPFLFDVERNWALVRALLTNPTINVQWLFISEGLKRLLLEHALEIDEPPFLIERASRILHQPTDAAPHDDHLHLRIGCSREDRLEGCIDWGPRWDWYDWHEAALFARTREIQRAFQESNPSYRRNALIFLQRIRSPFAPEVALRYGVHDPHPDVRAEAFSLLEELPIQNATALTALADALEALTLDNDEERILYRALRLFDSPDVIDIAIARYERDDLTVRERGRALRALDHHMAPRLIPFFLQALPQEEHPGLRAHLARQLHRVAARTDGLDWEEPLADEHRRALLDWEMWWEEEAPRDRQALLKDLVARKGVHEWDDLQEVDTLIPFLRSDDDSTRYNINLILSDWTGRWVPRDWQNDDAAYQFWSRWWDRNRERMLRQRPEAWQ